MNNQFVYGLIVGLVISLMVSCSTSLEAGGSECGESWNPCHVRIVD